MGLEVIPEAIRARYHIEERGHACAILSVDCPEELADIIACLDQFVLLRSEIVEGGGGKSKIAARFDNFLGQRGWSEVRITFGGPADERDVEEELHKVELCKGRTALVVKREDQELFYSWNLSAFRFLHELGVISVGVIIARRVELKGRADASAAVWDELEGIGAGRCPLLLIGITAKSYRDDLAHRYNSSFSSKTLSS